MLDFLILLSQPFFPAGLENLEIVFAEEEERNTVKIAAFELNVTEYPDASNPYDSLGEAYLAAGDTARAIVNYEKSVELNPDNTGGIAVLERIGR